MVEWGIGEGLIKMLKKLVFGIGLLVNMRDVTSIMIFGDIRIIEIA